MNIVQALLDIGMVVSGVILVREGLRSGKMGSGRSRKVVGGCAARCGHGVAGKRGYAIIEAIMLV